MICGEPAGEGGLEHGPAPRKDSTTGLLHCETATSSLGSRDTGSPEIAASRRSHGPWADVARIVLLAKMYCSFRLVRTRGRPVLKQYLPRRLIQGKDGMEIGPRRQDTTLRA